MYTFYFLLAMYIFITIGVFIGVFIDTKNNGFYLSVRIVGSFGFALVWPIFMGYRIATD